MKWARARADSIIYYVADRFYDRLRDRVLDDLAPFAGKRKDAAKTSVFDLSGWLP
ncbi:hypothetical protein [Mycobacteroides chelonae]|uniref:hypothetical protein n=1 Tax=Mycobacteroides chelonae TaxID=1774 RepID=UPI0018E3F5E7|nr:hypothetical protein [Mycobacteroides chelonae]